MNCSYCKKEVDRLLPRETTCSLQCRDLAELAETQADLAAVEAKLEAVEEELAATEIELEEVKENGYWIAEAAEAGASAKVAMLQEAARGMRQTIERLWPSDREGVRPTAQYQALIDALDATPEQALVWLENHSSAEWVPQ